MNIITIIVLVLFIGLDMMAVDGGGYRYRNNTGRVGSTNTATSSTQNINKPDHNVSRRGLWSVLAQECNDSSNTLVNVVLLMQTIRYGVGVANFLFSSTSYTPMVKTDFQNDSMEMNTYVKEISDIITISTFSPPSPLSPNPSSSIITITIPYLPFADFGTMSVASQV